MIFGEDLGLQPNTVKQAKFEYSPLGKVFTKGLYNKDDQKEGLFKKLKNIVGKNEEQLKVLKDQSEKQPIISKVKNPNFNNVSFRNLLDTKSLELFNEIRDQYEIIDYSRLNFFGSSKKYIFNFENFMSLKNLAKNIYNGNVSLDAVKQEQRRMKNMLESFIDYNPVKNVYKNQINNILLNAKEFYNRRKEVLIAFEENMFPLPKPYVFWENEWKERDLRKEEFMPKILKRSFLSELGYIPLSEKKDELLNKHFKFENIDELLEAFNNTETKEEYNKLFDRISNQAIIFKKLVKTVSNPVEKKEL